MNTASLIVILLIVFVLARGLWVLAYAYSPRRVIQDRLRAYVPSNRDR